MAKIEVEILGLTASAGSNGAYALILKETGGERRLPIVIGAPEAQAIAAELEGVRPTRPMTHDLLKNIIEQAGGTVSEVCIVDLRESIFYAQITIEGLDLHVDARPSDAIALAVRFRAPIYVMDTVLDEAGITPEHEEEFIDEDDDDDDDQDELMRLLQQQEEQEDEPRPARRGPTSRLEQLRRELDQAIRDEDYERAARIRDEIQRLEGSDR
ncbi:MAG: bifunctional nuclease family protein [Bacteroidota bacterium]|nr:bifunctional nuclease family protein [Candidatus Kapabacteria bacterium]MCS7302439.1 bifunctional nuclease family protein [Candidatus Kapabacteria bacterium]MCX7936328.1 bifunctional nuclease family protein [Chlorobiota bacterium]MDW8074391.1 bifunctional nuclease family protein [Bacteroidota bacterium]MDW8271133.1 bifunctional nuclease family protein [Bacteroidota bacterium]